MLNSLLSGISPIMSNSDDPEEDLGGVVLRREQVRLVLFEGKAGVVENDGHVGTTKIFSFFFTPEDSLDMNSRRGGYATWFLGSSYR